jgi:cilia- and flagella-associated protein 52
MGKVTSMAFTTDKSHFFCGTGMSNIYWVDTENLTPELRNTCHNDKINDIAFPM